MVGFSALRSGLIGWRSFTALNRAAARQWTFATQWGGRLPYSATTSASVNPVEEIEESPRSGDVWDERQKVLKPTAEPAVPASVMLFPGQGTQHVGMGQAACHLPVVREMFETASSVLGYDLLSLCRDGPISKLNSTRYSQPAIFVCSLAAVEKLKAESPEAIDRCAAAAGYSVGEYAALVFGGALSFKSAVHLVKIRASLMQTACEVAPSGMLTMRIQAGADLEGAMEAARIWAEKNGVSEPVCQVASSLYSQCKVIGGHDKALRFLADKGNDFGLIPVKRVEVSGAFHTPLMDSASKGLRRALQMVKFSKPAIKVYSNVLARPYQSALEIPDSLAIQVSKEVKWEQILHAIYDRPQNEEIFPTTYETGPGDHLGKMLKRVNSKAFANYHIVEP